jgi:hypothetical protein
MRVSEPLDPVLYEHAVKLLSALGWTGLAMVEFKTGADGPALMEINGRVWGSLSLAVASGVDFPRLAADLYMGHPLPDRLPDYAAGIRASNLLLDIGWIASVLAQRGPTRDLGMPPRRAVVGALRDLASPRTRFDAFSVDDPRPAGAEILAIAAKIATRLRGRA